MVGAEMIACAVEGDALQDGIAENDEFFHDKLPLAQEVVLFASSVRQGGEKVSRKSEIRPLLSGKAGELCGREWLYRE